MLRSLRPIVAQSQPRWRGQHLAAMTETMKALQRFDQGFQPPSLWMKPKVLEDKILQKAQKKLQGITARLDSHPTFESILELRDALPRLFCSLAIRVQCISDSSLYASGMEAKMQGANPFNGYVATVETSLTKLQVRPLDQDLKGLPEEMQPFHEVRLQPEDTHVRISIEQPSSSGSRVPAALRPYEVLHVEIRRQPGTWQPHFEILRDTSDDFCAPEPKVKFELHYAESLADLATRSMAAPSVECTTARSGGRRSRSGEPRQQPPLRPAAVALRTSGRRRASSTGPREDRPSMCKEASDKPMLGRPSGYSNRLS